MEDDPDLRENLAGLLDVSGYDVCVAEEATQAYRQLDENRIDLIIADFLLPGPTGVEVIETARIKNPTVPAILMTAFGEDFVRAEHVTASGIEFLPKPFEAEALVNLVGRILGKGADRPAHPRTP